MAKSGNRPVHEVRCRNVKAAIWLNQTAEGTMHNVTVSCSCRDVETWKNAYPFGPAGLLPLAKELNRRIPGFTSSGCGSEVVAAWR